MHSTAPATLQLLDRRDKEAAGTDARSRNDRLRYNARLYRLLGAVLLAATLLMPLPPAVAPPGPGLASTVDQLRRLVQRMAMLVVGSCLAVQREYAAQRAQAAAGRVGLAVLDVEDDLGSALRSLGDVRQRLQVRRGLGWVWGLVWKSAGRLRPDRAFNLLWPTGAKTASFRPPKCAGAALWPAERAVAGAAGVGRPRRLPEHPAAAQAGGGGGGLRPGALLGWVRPKSAV